MDNTAIRKDGYNRKCKKDIISLENVKLSDEWWELKDHVRPSDDPTDDLYVPAFKDFKEAIEIAGWDNKDLWIIESDVLKHTKTYKTGFLPKDVEYAYILVNKKCTVMYHIFNWETSNFNSKMLIVKITKRGKTAQWFDVLDPEIIM